MIGPLRGFEGGAQPLLAGLQFCQSAGALGDKRGEHQVGHRRHAEKRLKQQQRGVLTMAGKGTAVLKRSEDGDDGSKYGDCGSAVLKKLISRPDEQWNRQKSEWIVLNVGSHQPTEDEFVN